MIKRVDKLWGYEEWLVNNELYCAKYLHITKGAQCSLHMHVIKDETFYLISGSVEIEVDSGRGLISYSLPTPLKFIRIKPKEYHRFKALENSILLEVSTHHDDRDSIRKELSKPAISEE